MKKLFYAILFICGFIISTNGLKGQVIYGTYGQASTFYMAAIDLSTCTACVVFQMDDISHSSSTILPDGSFLVTSIPSGNVSIYSPPSQVPTNIPLVPATAASGSTLFNGLVYIFGFNGLHYYDPATNSVTYVGPWPAGMPPGSFELFVENGQLYAVQYGGNYEVWEVDVTDPLSSTLLQSIPGLSNVISSATANASSTFFVSMPWVYAYGVGSNAPQQACNLNTMGIFGTVDGISVLPSGLSPPPCLCTTDAGTVQNNVAEICLPLNAEVPFNNDETLDNDDVLQYILFSNLHDTLGSILVIINIPNIPFNPATMQTGVTYYLATIAGDNLNGNVDLNDDCLSVSNASEVIWHPQPSVSFAAPNPDVCVGGCIALEVTLTGTPPFSLTGEILAGANVVGTFNENYLQNNGTLNACAPLGTAPGSLSVQAITLSDANCSCL